jgi:CBS domain-containing protein
MLRDIIDKNLVTVRHDSSIAEVAKLMKDKDVGCVLIVQDNRPRGLITDRDIVIRCLADYSDISKFTTKDFMTDKLETVLETDGLHDCIKKMRQAKVRRIPVVDKQGMPVGIISFGDIVGILGRELYDVTQATTATGDDARGKAA